MWKFHTILVCKEKRLGTMKNALSYFTAAFSAMGALALVAHLTGHGEYIFHAGFLGLVIIAMVGALHLANVMGKRSEVFDAHILTVERLDGKVDKLDEKLDKEVDKLDTKIDKLDTKVDKLDARVGGLETKVDKLDARVGGLETKVGGLETKVGGIHSVLTQLVSLIDKDGQIDLDAPMLKSSPYYLSEFGKKIVKKINGQTLLEKYVHKIDVPEGINAYEIQEQCFNYAKYDLMKEVTNEEKDIIQMYAYESGDPMYYATDVMGVLFRDYWFKERGVPIPKPKTAKPKKRA